MVSVRYILFHGNSALNLTVYSLLALARRDLIIAIDFIIKSLKQDIMPMNRSELIEKLHCVCIIPRYLKRLLQHSKFITAGKRRRKAFNSALVFFWRGKAAICKLTMSQCDALWACRFAVFVE